MGKLTRDEKSVSLSHPRERRDTERNRHQEKPQEVVGRQAER